MSLRFDHLQESPRDSVIALRFFELEDAYQSNVIQGLMAAILLHAAVALMGGLMIDIMRVDTQNTVEIGYEGPTRTLEDLEIIEPNSVQSYFFQRERLGVMAAPEYSITEPLELDPGPEPVKVRMIKKKVEAPKVMEVPERVELIEPLKAYHKPTSHSNRIKILKAVKPFYPEYESQRSIQADVTIAFLVTAEGRIKNEFIRQVVTKPAGASPRAFELSSLEAIRQWRFRPFSGAGSESGIWQEYTIRFNNDGKTSTAEVSW